MPGALAIGDVKHLLKSHTAEIEAAIDQHVPTAVGQALQVLFSQLGGQPAAQTGAPVPAGGPLVVPRPTAIVDWRLMLRAAAVSAGCCLLGGIATGLMRPVVLALELRETVRMNPLLNGAAAVEQIVACLVQDGVIDA